MTTAKKFPVILLLGVILAACGQAEPTFDESAYEQEIADWRAARLEALLQPTGYLNQTGLFWLEDGNYSFGTDEDNDVVFPGDAPPVIGSFEVSEEGIRMRVESGVDVLFEGEPVDDIVMVSDVEPEPVIVTLGSLAWGAVERDGNFAIRLRDFEHPFVKNFGPLSYYPIDPALRVNATLERYPEPRIANVGTVIEGLGYHPESPGVLVFEIDGQSYELEAYSVGERLFFVFGDATNRDDTYGAGRFVYAAAPGEGGSTVLDFNKSYSPPCAFNDFSTCPVASPRNRLPIRIEAGELYDPALHFSAGVH